MLAHFGVKSISTPKIISRLIREILTSILIFFLYIVMGLVLYIPE